MSKIDAIALVAFDDEPTSGATATLDPRPVDRPRPSRSAQRAADPIALVAFDSAPEDESPLAPTQDSKRPMLAFDISLLDLETDSFLVLYPAGTLLHALEPRTVSVPASASRTPWTTLTLYRRFPNDLQPVPYLTFQSGEDLRGRQLTLRFEAPADPHSWMLECDQFQWLATPGALPPSTSSSSHE